MSSLRRSSQRRPSGFTLVELLVAMGIIVFLFALTVAFLVGIYQRKDTATAAQQIQGLLLKVKMKAKRDGKPCGIRRKFWSC